MITNKKKLSPLLQDLNKLNILSLFLAQNQQIMTSIQQYVVKNANYTVLIMEMISRSCNKINQDEYLDPYEKYQHIRGVFACIFLLNNSQFFVSKIDKKKELFSKIEKMIKENIVIPMIGDMQLNSLTIFKKIHSVDLYSILNLNDPQFIKLIPNKYNLNSFVSSIQSQQFKITADLGRCKALLINSKNKNFNVLNDDYNHEDATSIYCIIQDSFIYLSRLTEYVQTYFSWKMVNPTFKNQKEDIDPYESLTKYNYTNEEKVAMVRAITYIKTLYNILADLEPDVTPAIASYIYYIFQNFISTEIDQIITKIGKSSKNDIMRILLTGMKSACFDINFIKLKSDNSKSNVKKKDLNYNHYKFKSTSPLSTQIYILSTTMNLLLKNQEYKKLIDNTLQTVINEFLSKIPIFMGLVNYGKTLRSCCYLGSFWFREFYLEMASSTRIQYSIEASVPWIFASHILTTSDPSLIESLLFVLDLYNDSAQYALTVLKRKFLYDEIEAEVNLIFEQLVHLLAEKIYLYYRYKASSQYFQKSVRLEISKAINKYSDKKQWSDYQINYQSDHHYITLMTQKSVQLLGREINLSFLLSQRIILAIRKSLDFAFTTYENTGINNIMEFHQIIQVIKLTHTLLSEHLNLSSFTVLFDEANHGVRSYMTRITLHSLSNCVNDLIPNYAYCSSLQRFFKSPITYVKEIHSNKNSNLNIHHFYGSKSLSLAYSSCAEIYRQFIGSIHFKTLLQYLGHGGLAVIIEQITRYTNVLITEKLAKYVTVLKQGLPPKISLPRFQYGFSGTVKFYTVNFENIFKYKDLYPRIFQCMREIGNCIVFVYQLEAAKVFFFIYFVIFI